MKGIKRKLVVTLIVGLFVLPMMVGCIGASSTVISDEFTDQTQISSTTNTTVSDGNLHLQAPGTATSISTGSYFYGFDLAYDGEYVYISEGNTMVVYVVYPSNGTLAYQFNLPSSGFSAIGGITWENETGTPHLWVIGKDKKVYQLYTNGTQISNFTHPDDTIPLGMAWNASGDSLWMWAAWRSGANYRTLYQVDRTGTVLSSLSFRADFCTDGRGLAYDGTDLFLEEKNLERIYRISPTTVGSGVGGLLISGDEIDSFESVNDPGGIAWGDGYLWDMDSTNKILYQLLGAYPLDGIAITTTFSAPSDWYTWSLGLNKTETNGTVTVSVYDNSSGTPTVISGLDNLSGTSISFNNITASEIELRFNFTSDLDTVTSNLHNYSITYEPWVYDTDSKCTFTSTLTSDGYYELTFTETIADEFDDGLEIEIEADPSVVTQLTIRFVGVESATTYEMYRDNTKISGWTRPLDDTIQYVETSFSTHIYKLVPIPAGIGETQPKPAPLEKFIPKEAIIDPTPKEISNFALWYLVSTFAFLLLLHFTGVVTMTGRQIVVGAFFGYFLPFVAMQRGWAVPYLLSGVGMIFAGIDGTTASIWIYSLVIALVMTRLLVKKRVKHKRATRG